MERRPVAAPRTTPTTTISSTRRSKERLRRNRPAAPLVTLGVLGVMTGAAFAGGAHLRARFTDHLVGGRAGLAGTRLAQADMLASGSFPAYGGVPGLHAAAAPPRPGAPTADEDEDDATFLNAVGLFEEVYATVKDSYVDKLPGQTKMAQGAVRAMVAELNDPNCRFVEPAERAALQAQEKDGRFAGIGAALRVVGTKRDGYTEHKITVVAPLPGSPAEKAGLRAGDVITSVDNKYVLTAADPFAVLNRVVARIESGEATSDEVEKANDARDALFQRVQSGVTLEKVLRALTVGENEKRTLIVQRAGGAKEPLTFVVTTAATTAPAPATRALAGGATYVRVPVFTTATAGALTSTLANDNNGGIVLDLRDNPGGPLPVVQSVAGALLRATRRSGGGVVNTGNLFTLVGPKNKRVALSAAGPPVSATTGKSVAPAAASPTAPRPIVVLVNKGTANEAEALAVALRDKGVATLMGGRTFGDALIQTLFPLADGSGFLLTTGKLIGATGTDWQNAGLAPAIALAAGTSEEQVLNRAAGALRSGVASAADPSR